MIKRLIFTLLVAVVMIGCKKTENEDVSLTSFRNVEALGAYNKAEAIFTFDEAKHQTAINATKLTFRIQNDYQNAYMSATLGSKAEYIGAVTTISIITRGISGMETKAYNVTVEKISSDKVWLWESTAQLGFVIPKF